MNPLAVEIWLYVLAAYTLGECRNTEKWTLLYECENKKETKLPFSPLIPCV